ncbi:copper amine oxidase [Hysterangium stoloniferum]|nr:copper amine oxidase [Hysterangium stoloniferum]
MTPVPSSTTVSTHVVDTSEYTKPLTATKVSTKVVKPFAHPLDPLTSDEIYAISLVVRKHVAEHTDVKAVKFITCATANPPKRDVLAYLGIPIVTGEKPEVLDKDLIRKAELDFIDLVTGDAYDVILAFKGEDWIVETITKLPEGTQPQISVQELAGAELAVRNDPQIQKLAAEIGLKPEQIYADGWSIGWDARFPKHVRLQQAIMFARFSEHGNLYAHPLDFMPVLDSNSLQVIHIDFPPHRVGCTDGEETESASEAALSVATTAVPSLTEDALLASGRARLRYPEVAHEYLPDLRANQPGVKASTREPLKPLHVLQPEGVTFEMNGNELTWQKWKMHIAFNHREGIAISTVTYDDDGVLRPLLYRMSLVEMVVPYGAPEHPHPRKFAFDVGEYGIGTQANDLTLGCDCLGRIHYLPGVYIGQDGHPTQIKRAICIHEEDAGILWKHTDYREGGRAHTVRSRRLVVSMICTVANYEYCFYYYFYQDGGIELETKLTGILNVYMLAPGEPSGPFATQVAPRIGAQYHQHLFSVRIDPMIDGLLNSVVESDVVALANAPTGSKENWAGNAFTVEERTLLSAKEGGRDYDFEKDRRWTIVNTGAGKHYASGKAPGYVLGYRGFAGTLLAAPGSWVVRRAGFATKSLWVVKDVEDGLGGRMWPAGRYVPQTTDAPEDSVEGWTQTEESIENEDIVLFLTLGVNHIPRPEDWPVMPVEQVRLTLKPVHFFDANPSLDVPGLKDSVSAMAFENGTSKSSSNGISNDPANGTPNPSTNGTLNHSTNGTSNPTSNGASEHSSDGTSDHLSNGTPGHSNNETLNHASNGTLCCA